MNKNRQPIKNVNTGAMSAVTGFCSTAEDLCNYFSAHFVGSGKLLDDESKKEMQRTQWQVTNTKQNQEYGFGFTIEHVGERRLLGHGGAFPGHIMSSQWDLKNNLVVVVLTNCIDCDATHIAKSIVSIIDYFVKDDLADSSQLHLKKFEERFMSLWCIKEIVVTGKKVISFSPDTWEPFSETEELEFVDDHTLKVIKANGYSCEGEFVRFNFSENGDIESLTDGGVTMWPEVEYLRRTADMEIYNYSDKAVLRTQ